MYRLWIVFGATYGFLSVAIGAFAAHGLKGRIDDGALANVETGARYQMYAALALGLIGLLVLHAPSRWLNWSGGCFALGGFFFSGSLYVLALTSIRGFGIITPLGGLFFLAGWILLAISAIKMN